MTMKSFGLNELNELLEVAKVSDVCCFALGFSKLRGIERSAQQGRFTGESGI